ncbi:ATP-dependent helicase [Corynebacterium aquatimens]
MENSARPLNRQWDHDLPTEGRVKVTGEAGSGVTSFLIDTAVNVIERGADPSGVVFITSSKDAAARVRRAIGVQLSQSQFLVDEPIARSVHSLAFAIVRQREGEQIRLISGAEQDMAIRDLLAGHEEYGTGSWPLQLRPALPLVGFARQLRDFLLRAVERGVTPNDLREAGADNSIPVWSAAGDFLEEYQKVMALYGTKSYSASELVAEAVRGPLPEKWHTVIVDDAQHLSPSAVELVRRLSSAAHLTVVGGDSEQSVFQFRGAAPEFFREFDAPTIDLGRSRRNPETEVVIAGSASLGTAAVVDRVRRTHLGVEGVAWKDIAVIVRSTSMIEPIRRALIQARVPVAVDPTDVVLVDQPIVRAMMLGLEALNGELSTAQWRELLLSPVGGSDPVSLRKLLRGLRRGNPDRRPEETLSDLIAGDLSDAAALGDFESVLTEREHAILQRIRSVLGAGRAALEAGEGVEAVLWAVWSATGLSERLLHTALRGGATGSQADRSLDAIMALFDAAGDFAERRETAGLDAFIAHINGQELPTGVRDRRVARPDAVALLTAHGAVGKEFQMVVVAGVQEGSWPQLSETGSIFRQEDFIDYLDSGIDPATPISHVRDRLAEERRLFHVATTRAHKKLVVTAVDVPDGDEIVEPSRFVDELLENVGTEPTVYAAGEPLRVLAREDLIAELRRNAADESADEKVREAAAEHLAQLGNAGIADASPEKWWTLTEPSTSEAMPTRNRLSPSRIEALLKCPMRSVVEDKVVPFTSTHMAKGNLLHYYFEALERGADYEAAKAMTLAAYESLFDVPFWMAESDRAAFATVLERCRNWLRAVPDERRLLGVEVPVEVQVAHDLTISARIDRLEDLGDNTVHVYDLKSGMNAPTKAKMPDHAQLAAYQLALSKGKVKMTHGQPTVVTADDHEAALNVDGATLLYPEKSQKVTALTQEAKTAEELDEFLELISSLPAEMTGPRLRAQAGDHCTYCKIKALCPVQPEGEKVHHG